MEKYKHCMWKKVASVHFCFTYHDVHDVFDVNDYGFTL